MGAPADTGVRDKAEAPHAAAGSVLGWTIVVLSLVQLMVVLDGTVVNLALARIQSDLGLSDSGRTMVITAYALAFGGLMLLGGRLGDSFGRKRMFTWGVAAFTFASLLAGFATNEELLVAARILQGASAAVVSPTAFALVATSFAVGPVRNQAFAIFAMMTGVGSVSGLLLGGLLTELSWRWIFWVNIPVGLFILALTPRALRESQGERRPLDVKGAILATASCSMVVWGLTQGPEAGWGDPRAAVPLMGGLVLVGLFLLVERTADNPLLPFVLFRNRNRVAAFAAVMAGGAITMCTAVYIALYVQDILKFSPLQAGLSFVPFAFALAISAQVASALASRVQARWLVAFGGVLLVVGFLLFALTVDPQSTYLGNLLVPIVICGCGFGFAFIPLTVCTVAGVGPAEIGPLTAISLVAQTLGGAVGLGVVSAFATSRTLAEGGAIGKAANMTGPQLNALASGYMSAVLACAVIAFATIVLVVFFMRFTVKQVAQSHHAEDHPEG